jgi:hypothetical protein
MWLLARDLFKNPYIPMLNWEELGKIDSNLLRTMRQISFSKPSFSEDCGDRLIHKDQELYQLLPIELRAFEEWPSEAWNFQDNYLSPLVINACLKVSTVKDHGLEETESNGNKNSAHVDIAESDLIAFFNSVNGIGKQLYTLIIEQLGVDGTIDALNKNPHMLLKIKGLKEKKLQNIIHCWQEFLALDENKVFS